MFKGTQEITSPFPVSLRKNSAVSLFEKYLSLGQLLSEDERLALYKYLLEVKRNDYRLAAKELLRNGFLEKSIANGELKYEVAEGNVTYKARMINSLEYTPSIRTISIGKIKYLNKRNLATFFAQAEADVIRNYPLLDFNDNQSSGYGINKFPYYDFNYYSDGKGKLMGFIKKLQSKESDALRELRAS